MSVWSYVRSMFGGRATHQNTGSQIGEPGNYATPSAQTVTEDTALTISAVWACARLISETVASLPLNVYEITDTGPEVAKNNNLHTILHTKPNARQTSIEFRETMTLNLVMHGNAYALIERNNLGQVTSLVPLAAQQTQPKLLADESLVYEYYSEKGVAVYAENSILHVRLFGNGMVGLSPLAYARNSIGLGLATEEFGTTYFTNGGKPSGILMLDKVLSDEQRDAVRKNFSTLVEGSSNANRLMVLEASMKYEQVQINPSDMQMIEARRFQVEDVARFFGVPSVLINDNSQSTTWGTGIEAIVLGFYKLNLRPYLTRFEQAYQNKLLSPVDRAKYSIEHVFEGLLRGDSKSRAEFYSKMVQNGLMTRNEVRSKENLPTREGADELTVQVNMTPVDELGSATDGNKD